MLLIQNEGKNPVSINEITHNAVRKLLPVLFCINTFLIYQDFPISGDVGRDCGGHQELWKAQG